MHPVNLNSLPSGSSAFITEVKAETALERRLLALGFRAGQQVHMIRKAMFSGPIHVRVGTTEIMLRRADACSIQVQQQVQVIHIQIQPA
jgi:ferrous iron transport protein A